MSIAIRAISLHEPWASAMRLGVKRIETRSWAFPEVCLGVPIAIAATQRREFIKDWHHKVASAEGLARVGPSFEMRPVGYPGEAEGMTAIRALAAVGLRKESDFLPGRVVAVAVFEWARPVEEVREKISAVERSLGGYVNERADEHRWAMRARVIVPLGQALEAKGSQGFWTWQMPESLVPEMRKGGIEL